MKKQFWPAAFYFFFYAALSAYGPSIALYYQSLGISGSQIGLLLAIPPLITLVASPFWTGLADASHRHKVILVCLLAAVIGFILLVPLAGSTHWLFVLVASFAFFGAPIIPLVDSATLSMLGERREMYGRIRMWGTVGWAITAPIVGVIYQRNGLAWMFPIYAGLMALNLFVSSRLTFTRSSASTPFWHGIRSILTNRHWILFLSKTFIAAIGLATISNYLFVLLGSLNVSKSMMGIALLISTISEIPVMFFGNVLLKRFKSRGLLSLAMGVTAMRLILYYFITAPFMIFALQLVHGFTYPAFFLAGVNYASENAPPGLGATAQGLFASMIMGFGAAAGSLLGGYLLERLGPQGMYGVIGVFVLVSLGVFSALESRMEPKPVQEQGM